MQDYISTEQKLREAFNLLSSVNKEAYKDIFLLSNQVLSKNPYTSSFLERFVSGKSETAVETSSAVILTKLLKYFLFSIKNFISYLMEFIEFYCSGLNFQHSSTGRELIILANYFIIGKIQEKQTFRDDYFPGLSELLQKNKKVYAYSPVFEGIKKRLTMFRVFRILKNEKAPVLTEYQLLSGIDLCRIFYFILAYPFCVLRLLKNCRNRKPEYRLLRNELIDTLDQVTFPSYSRYLQGRKIAKLPFDNIKVISWYENQVIDKNLYKGLRQNKKAKIYGAQLFLYAKNHLNIIPDENEAAFGIIPDKILVNGPVFIPERTRLNYIVGPSLRYAKIFSTKIIKENRKNILVLLPYFKEDIENILRIVSGIEVLSKPIFIKIHPSVGIDEFKYLLPVNTVIVKDDIYKIFKTAKILIGAASGTLIEAASLGIPAISIRNMKRFDCNPLPSLGKGIIWEEASSPEGLKQQINRFEYLIDNKHYEIDNISEIYRKLFFREPTKEAIVKSFDL